MSEDLLARTMALYDTVAASYARMLPDTAYEAAPDLAMIEHFVTLLQPGARVLDAGCGTGRLLSHLGRLGPTLSLTGIDLSPGMIAEARAAHPEVELAVGDLAALPYPDGRFDGVLAWYSIIHTPPHALGPIFAEFHRVLATGSALLLAYQEGTGRRVSRRPYGHEVELLAFLHDTTYVRTALAHAGFEGTTHLVRDPRPGEPYPQGFVLVRRP